MALATSTGCSKPPVPDAPPPRPPDTPNFFQRDRPELPRDEPPAPPPPPAAAAPAEELQRLGNESEVARDVVCGAIEFSDDAQLVQDGQLSQGAFVNKYRALYASSGAEAARAAFSAWGLIRAASEGDLAAVSVGLACAV